MEIIVNIGYAPVKLRIPNNCFNFTHWNFRCCLIYTVLEVSLRLSRKKKNSRKNAAKLMIKKAQKWRETVVERLKLEEEPDASVDMDNLSFYQHLQPPLAINWTIIWTRMMKIMWMKSQQRIFLCFTWIGLMKQTKRTSKCSLWCFMIYLWSDWRYVRAPCRAWKALKF